MYSFISFFFQAEDGIRDATVTGVQTCALPISANCGNIPIKSLVSGTVPSVAQSRRLRSDPSKAMSNAESRLPKVSEIGRASCRERVQREVDDGGTETRSGDE